MLEQQYVLLSSASTVTSTQAAYPPPTNHLATPNSNFSAGFFAASDWELAVIANFVGFGRLNGNRIEGLLPGGPS